MSEKTYTEEQYTALLAKVSDLEAKVVDLSTAAEASQMDAKIAAARAEVETKVTDLQSQLDAAVLEAEAAKNSRDAVVQWLEGEATAAQAAAELAARMDDRIAKVKEVASFPDAYVEANAERWAGMPEELFVASLEDWKTIAPKGSESTSKNGIPAVTAMTAARTDTNKGTDVLTEVLDLRFHGIDARRV